MSSSAMLDEYDDEDLYAAEFFYMEERKRLAQRQCKRCTDKDCSCIEYSADDPYVTKRSLDLEQPSTLRQQQQHHHVAPSEYYRPFPELTHAERQHAERQHQTTRLVEQCPFTWDSQADAFVEAAKMPYCASRPQTSMHSETNVPEVTGQYGTVLLNQLVSNRSNPRIKSQMRIPERQCEWVTCPETQTLCNQALASAQELTEHLKIAHIGARHSTYSCRWLNCDRHDQPFPQKQKIMRHMVVHTDYRPFKCDDCDYACSEESALKQHKRKHTGEKPYSCSICPKKFRASTSLSVHLRVHSKEKPLKCKFCDKRFSESSNMAKHVRTHSTERPHHCLIGHCGKKFQRPDQLKRHLRSVHKRGPNESKL